jgi:hypothetical protein
MATAREVIKTTEEYIRLKAVVEKTTEPEATTKHFSEHPDSYTLYIRALREGGAAAEPRREATRALEPGPAERRLNEIADAHVAAGMSRAEATAKACSENPELYAKLARSRAEWR